MAEINLLNSQRSVSKATYAPARFAGDTPLPTGQVLEKAAYARGLAVTRTEYLALEAQVADAEHPPDGSRPLSGDAVNLVARITWGSWPDVIKAYGPQLAQTARQDLVQVGLALVDLRRAAADTAASAPVLVAARVGGLMQNAAPADVHALADLAFRTDAVVRAFEFHSPVQPVGALHLERLEMTPAGVERGELVHSVPMTPGETVNISHREWTVTTQTFESIVQDSFEGFSETGITDKTDLSQATESETRHSTSLDINGSITASYNGGAYSVTASAATDYSDKTESRNSVKDSIAHSVAITRNASARTRKEHKTSFRVSSVAGTEDLAIRTLTNPTPNPIRVDYFQLIRKWRVDLIRYGLRLTYDLVIPNPGIDLAARVKELEDLEEWLSTATFEFDLTPGDVQPTEQSWLDLQAKYGILLDHPPPPSTPVIPIAKTYDKHDTLVDFLEVDVPDGYALAGGTLQAYIHQYQTSGSFTPYLYILDRKATFDPNAGEQYDLALLPPIDLASPYAGTTGHIMIPFDAGNFYALQFAGSFTASVLAKVQADWQAKTWQALHDAAQDQFNQKVQRAQDRKAYLEEQIGSFDALTLRKMEHEEVMKWVLLWLLGSLSLGSDPASQWATSTPGPDEEPANTGPEGLPIPSSAMASLDPAALTAEHEQEVREYGDFVRFIHDAVEWENMLFFAYPYFWDAAQNWPFKRYLMHPDPVHREFLRAGAARVVLTIRPGFEDAFIRLAQTGDYQATDQAVAAVGGTPYVSLGQTIHNQDLTNYQNIPPANPDRTARPLLYALQQQAWDDMQAIIGALEEFKSKNHIYPSGPEAGLPGKLKNFLVNEPQTVPGTSAPSFAAMLRADLQNVPVSPGGNFDDPAAVFTDPWGNPYHYTTATASTPILHGDYELVSYGSDNAPGSNPTDPLSDDITSWADGLLIGQWYEYTPTSALDVSVDTALAIPGPALPG